MIDQFEAAWERRRRAQELRDTNPQLTNAEIAKQMGVSAVTIGRYLARRPGINRASIASQARRARGRNEAAEATRQEQAFDLRLQGLPPAAVAREMGVTTPTVKRWIEDEINSRIEPRVQALRLLESARLDVYLTRLQPGIDVGNPKAITAALRISQRRAALLGLNAPVLIDATVHEVTEQDLELQEMLREAEAANVTVEGQLEASWRAKEPEIDPHDDEL